MNRTNVEHVVDALLVQAGIAFFTGNWWAGGLAASMFFLGREHSQHEYRLTNGGFVNGLSPWEGFNIRKWTSDAQRDWLLPTAAVSLVALIAGTVR